MDALDRGKAKAWANVTALDRCADEVAAKVGDMVERLVNYSQQVSEDLRKARRELEEEIARGVAEAERTVYEEEPRLQTKVGNALRRFGSDSDALDLFVYAVGKAPFLEKTSDILQFTVTYPAELSQRVVSNSRHQALPCIQANSLRFFDFANHRWKPPVPLDKTTEIDEYSAYTMLSADRLVCVGGGYEGERSSSAFVITDTGMVSDLPDMMHPRDCPGIMFHEERNEVLVFGSYRGIPHSGSEVEYTGERLSIARSNTQWEVLPRMSASRHGFNPCLFHDLVFLCGHGSECIDAYSPTKGVITRMKATQPESYGCTLVAEQGVLTLISYNFTTRYRLGSDCQLVKTDCTSHEKHFTWLCASPVVCDGQVFITQHYYCIWMNAETGEKAGQVR